MYDPKSLKAEEFIDHQEVLDSLAWADAHKDDKETIQAVLDKARLHKGLSHREASLLLACDDPDVNEQIYKLAKEIKQAYYGNRIVLFAPLYLSNYCVNGCVYETEHVHRFMHIGVCMSICVGVCTWACICG